MHLHQKSNQFTSSNGIKLLLIVVVAQIARTNGALTQEEINDAISEANVPARYCGKRLTEAIKTFCNPALKNIIMRGLPIKKSYTNPETDFEAFDVDRVMSYNYDDELGRTHYKTDDPFLSNDIPLMFPSQANRRRRRGIIDECCKRACYKTELVQYCPPSRG